MKKNSSTSAEKIIIEKSDVKSLTATCRWSCESACGHSDEMVNDEQKQYLSELLNQPVVELKAIDIELLTKLTSADVIERFLRKDNYRIVADDEGEERDIVTEASLDQEEELVSEELAEIYLSQGLNELAKETYRKLSLLNPEKSIYFAELIEKVESNNQK